MLALLVGGVAAALCGFIVGLPSLRLRGDYLAIVTLGFGEIIRVVVQNTRGVRARAGPVRHPPALQPVRMVWFWVFLVVLVARRIAGSTHGRSLWAIREDEVAAEAMGVNTTGYKVRAFVISSFFAGVAGGLFAHFVPIINPGSFTFVKSHGGGGDGGGRAAWAPPPAPSSRRCSSRCCPRRCARCSPHLGADGSAGAEGRSDPHAGLRHAAGGPHAAAAAGPVRHAGDLGRAAALAAPAQKGLA